MQKGITWSYLVKEGDSYSNYLSGEGRDRAITTVAGSGFDGIGIKRSLTRAQFNKMESGIVDGERRVRPGNKLKVKVWDEALGKNVDKLDDKGEPIYQARRVGIIDVPIHLEKSFSELLAAIPHTERGQEFHDALVADAVAAVQAAHLEVIENANLVRHSVKTPKEAGPRATTTQGSQTRRVKAHTFATVVPQHTSRFTEESLLRGVQDPHFHLHLSVMAVAYMDDDTAKNGKRWLQIDSLGIARSQAQLMAVAEREIVRRWRDRGIDFDTSVDRSGKMRLDVKGSVKEACELFSSATREAKRIERDLEQRLGRPVRHWEREGERSRQRIAKPKGDLQDIQPDRTRWQEALRTAGIRVRSIDLDAEPVRLKPLEKRYEILTERIHGPVGLCREQSTFTEASIRPTIDRLAPDLCLTRAEVDAFEQDLRSTLITLRHIEGDPENSWVTTPKQREMERWTVEKAARKATERREPVPTQIEKWAVRGRFFNAVELDPEQREVVRAIASGQGLVIVSGFAGTGKSHCLRIAVAAVREHRPTGQIHALSTAAKTGKDLGQKIKADRSSSVASFIEGCKRGKIRPTENDTIILDEAWTLDTTQACQLLQRVGKAQLVLVGDNGQLLSIQASGWLDDLAEQVQPISLSRVHRQSDQRLVSDLKAIRIGHSNKAARGLDQRGCIVTSPDSPEKVARIIADRSYQRDQGVSQTEMAIIVDTSNHDLDLLARFVDRDELERGTLKGQGYEVTDVEGGRSWKMYEGEQVMSLQPVGQGVFKRPIPNGSTGTIVSLRPDGKAKIRLDGATREERRTISVRFDKDSWRQDWGKTSVQHASRTQGGEFPHVAYVPGGIGQVDRHSAYSAASRTKAHLSIYLDHETHSERPLETFAASIHQKRDKHSVAHVMAHDEALKESMGNKDRVQAYTLRTWITERHGEITADLLENARAWPSLVSRVRYLRDETDIDAKEAVNRALDGPLTDTRDPAAVLTMRINSFASERRAETVRAQDMETIKSWRDDRGTTLTGDRLAQEVMRQQEATKQQTMGYGGFSL